MNLYDKHPKACDRIFHLGRSNHVIGACLTTSNALQDLDMAVEHAGYVSVRLGGEDRLWASMQGAFRFYTAVTHYERETQCIVGDTRLVLHRVGCPTDDYFLGVLVYQGKHSNRFKELAGFATPRALPSNRGLNVFFSNPRIFSKDLFYGIAAVEKLPDGIGSHASAF